MLEKINVTKNWKNLQYKPEITIGDNGYETFSGAVTTIGATPATLVVPSGNHVAGGVTVPSTLTLRALRGVNFTVATGTTFTINGPLGAGLYQIFLCTGTGKVRFGPGAVSEVYPEWWGAKGDNGTTDNSAAIQAAGIAAILGVFPSDTGHSISLPLVFSAGRYKVNTQCIFLNTDEQTPKNAYFVGRGGTELYTTSTDIDGILCFQGPHPSLDGAGNRSAGVWINGLNLSGAATQAGYPWFSGVPNTTRGIKVWGIQNINFQNGYIEGFNEGLWVRNTDLITIDKARYVRYNNRGIVTDDSTGCPISTGAANSFNVTNCIINNNTTAGIDYYGGTQPNITHNNFVQNGISIKVACSTAVQGVATKPRIVGNYFESFTGQPYVETYNIYLGGGTANGLVRSGYIGHNTSIGIAAQTAMIYYENSAVDAKTVFDHNHVSNGACPVYATNANTVSPEIYGEGVVDYSATSNVVGWSSFAIKEIKYWREGKRIFFEFYLGGTSNSATTSFTLPFICGTTISVVEIPVRVCDNGTYSAAVGYASIGPGLSTITIQRDWSVAPPAFTASGTKYAIGRGWFDVD